MAKQPSCIIEELVEDPVFDELQFDGQLGKLLSKCEGDTTKYLSVVFGYLARKTNFFKEGAGDPQRKVLEAFKQALPAATATPSQPSKPAAAPAAARVAPAPAPAAPQPSTPAPTPAAASTSAPAAEQLTTATPPAATGEATTSAAPSGAEMETIEDEEPKSKGLKPNSGRGFDYAHYSWTQSLSEVNVSVKVPPGTKAKMLDVVVAKNKIKVGIKGQPAILEGELSEPIKTEDSMWNIEGGVVELTLTKQDGMHWWGAVLKGDEVIDVQKVEPENSKLQDLDAETRQTVEKMMFDQRQKALGLPTSEELKKEEMLKNFMKAHPEMDFSKLQR